MSAMNDLRKEEQLYDVCVVVGSQQIPAHKYVSVAANDYFKSLFTGPLKTDLAEVDLSSVALDIESAVAIINSGQLIFKYVFSKIFHYNRSCNQQNYIILEVVTRLFSKNIKCQIKIKIKIISI